MFEAACDKCGSRCEVSFRPNGEKPVYCRACFGRNDGAAPVGRSPDQQLKSQLDLINIKLDKLMKFLLPAQVQPEIAAVKPAKKAAKK